MACWSCHRDITAELYLVDHVGVEHAILFQIVRDGVLGEQRRLQSDLGSNPFAFRMWCARRMCTGAARAKLGPKGGFLDRIKLLEVRPGLMPNGSGEIDSESNGGHCKYFSWREEATAFRKTPPTFPLIIRSVFLATFALP